MELADSHCLFREQEADKCVMRFSDVGLSHRQGILACQHDVESSPANGLTSRFVSKKRCMNKQRSKRVIYFPVFG